MAQSTHLKTFILLWTVVVCAALPGQVGDRKKALADLRRALGGGEVSEEEVASARTKWPAQEAAMKRFIESQDRALAEGGARVNQEITHWREQVELSPQAMNFYLFGRILGFSGRLDAARDQFEATLDKDPFFYWAWRGLGTCYAKKQMHEQAIRHYSRAVELNPEDLEAGINLVAVQANAGQTERARATAAELLKWHPDDVELWWNLGGVLVADGQYAEATVAFENVRRLDADRDGVARFLGTCYLRTQKLEKALEVWEDWVARNPKDWTVHIGLGQLYQKMGRNHDAAKAFQNCLDHCPVEAPFKRERVEGLVTHLLTLPAVQERDRDRVTLQDVLNLAKNAAEPARRRKALRTLVAMGQLDPPILRATIVQALNDTDPHCRVIAMRAVAMWHENLKEFGDQTFQRVIEVIMPLLLKVPDDTRIAEVPILNGPVRAMAAHILGEQGESWAVPVLIDRLHERDPHAFRMIHRALNALTFAYIGLPEPSELDEETMQALRTDWQAWWKDNEALYPRK